MVKKRVEANDAGAINQLGSSYYVGLLGLPQDYGKAMELWNRAGELGYTDSFHNIAVAYDYAEGGVERDVEKATHYYELAAMDGNPKARYCLGVIEEEEGNINRAVRHYMIAAGQGYDDSLKVIRDLFANGYATKDDFEKALRTHKEAKDEMKSDQRDKAAAWTAANPDLAAACSGQNY